MPFFTAILSAFEHHPLKELIFAIAVTCRQSGFGEVHDHKLVSLALHGVSNAEVKPLLMTFSVCVDLHVQPVLLAHYSVCSEQVARLKDRVEQKDVSFVLFN